MGIILIELGTNEPDELGDLAEKLMKKIPAKVSTAIEHVNWLQWPEKEQEIVEKMKVAIDLLDEEGPKELS